MFNRLVAFGCSHTYGQGLPDCYNDISKVSSPSRSSWPFHLAKLMKINSIDNKGSPGASNKEIWKRIIDFKFKEDDIVVINWTYIERFCFFKNNLDTSGLLYNENITIQPGSASRIRNKTRRDTGIGATELSIWYYKNVYSETDGLIDMLIRMDHVKRYLDDIKVKHFHTLYNFLAIDNIPEVINGDYYKKILNFEVLPINFAAITEQYPRALDNSHPGLLAHKAFAEEIYKLIYSNTNHQLKTE